MGKDGLLVGSEGDSAGRPGSWGPATGSEFSSLHAGCLPFMALGSGLPLLLAVAS